MTPERRAEIEGGLLVKWQTITLGFGRLAVNDAFDVFKVVEELLSALAEAEKALSLAADELHEMRLSQRHGNVPRNPEMTTAAIAAIDAARKETANG